MTFPRMPRAAYVLLRLAECLLSSLSRFGNAALLAGSTHQTISARAYIEGTTDPKWAWRRKFIDTIFFFQADHCHWAWVFEVSNAQKTLDRNRKEP